MKESKLKKIIKRKPHHANNGISNLRRQLSETTAIKELSDFDNIPSWSKVSIKDLGIKQGVYLGKAIVYDNKNHNKRHLKPKVIEKNPSSYSTRIKEYIIWKLGEEIEVEKSEFFFAESLYNNILKLSNR
jgi:hypothetical protein